MKPFKEYHLLQLLNQFDPQKGPLDLSISHYFRQNKALGSKDRKYIAETAYFIIRWMGLIDYFVSSPKTWEKRLEFFHKNDLTLLTKDPNIPLHIRSSCPKILFQKLVDSYGEARAFEFAMLCNQRAPLTLRINESKISREDFMSQEEWKDRVKPCTFSPFGVHVLEHANLFQTQAFKDGLFEVQDEASQLVALLVEAKPKDKILDYCAGSGGKTLAFASKMQGKGCIYLHDKRASILEQAKKRLRRAGFTHCQIMEPGSEKLEQLIGRMDWVLLDVPCTGSGTYRRNPDLKWKFNEAMLQETVATQREIFNQAIKYVKANGHIVYSTCSLLKNENEDQIDYFLTHYPVKRLDSTVDSSKNFDLMDGFFGAVLLKS